MDLMKWAFGDKDVGSFDGLDVKRLNKLWQDVDPDRQDLSDMSLKDASLYVLRQYCDSLDRK